MTPPVGTPAELERQIAAARRAAARLLPVSVDRRLAVLDRVVATWLDAQSSVRREAEQALPEITGFSAAMIRRGLPTLFEPLRGEAIGALLDAELGDRRRLDQSRSEPARLIAHVLAGNIPALAAAPMLLSLAVKSAVLVKCAAGDPLTPRLLQRSLLEADADLGQCVMVADWRGGDRRFEDVAFGAADVVVASGSDAAIEAIAARVPGRFIGHGHKISFAVIGRECLRDAAAARDLTHRLAYDVAMWDQQGCLSPQLCYIESGGGIAPPDFAERLAAALAHQARELPPRRSSFEERAAVQRFRQQAEWQRDGGLLASRDSTDWSISIEPDPEFLPTCLNRCIRLKVVEDLSVLPAVLAAHRRHLEAAGIAVGAERAEAVSSMLAECGVHRRCAIGTMQRPDLSWRPGGRPRVAEWVGEKQGGGRRYD